MIAAIAVVFSLFTVLFSLAISLYAVDLAVAAANGKYEKRDVTAYLFSPDETVELECLFEKDVNLPYIKPEDFLDRAYEIDFSTKKNSRPFERFLLPTHVLTITTTPTASMSFPLQTRK